MLTNKDFLFVYDKEMSAYLKFKKGFTFITHAINPNSLAHYFMYEKSPELDAVVKEYLENKAK